SRDWSSDVCSSDLDVRRITALPTEGGGGRQEPARRCQARGRSDEPARNPRADAAPPRAFPEQAWSEAGARGHGRRAFRAARTPSARLRGRTALGEVRRPERRADAGAATEAAPAKQLPRPRPP